MSKWWLVTLVGTYRVTLELTASSRADALDKAFTEVETHVMDADRALEIAESLIVLESVEDVDECLGPRSAPSDVDGP